MPAARRLWFLGGGSHVTGFGAKKTSSCRFGLRSSRRWSTCFWGGQSHHGRTDELQEENGNGENNGPRSGTGYVTRAHALCRRCQSHIRIARELRQLLIMFMAMCDAFWYHCLGDQAWDSIFAHNRDHQCRCNIQHPGNGPRKQTTHDFV